MKCYDNKGKYLLKSVSPSQKKMFKCFFFLLTVLVFAALQVGTAEAQRMGIVKPLDKNGPPRPPRTETVTTGNGINYNGGPVMHGPHNIYLIWYGNWTNDTATTILPSFISGLNGSPYFNINSTYGDNTGNIADTVTLAGQFFDTGSQGTSLGPEPSGVAAVVNNALQNNKLPVDSNGIYFVLTSPDVTEGHFCTRYCGYHTQETFSSTDIKYSFVGNPATQCPNSCSAQTVTPNGNLGADAMANVMAHELSETVTDPDLDAWFDSMGNEVGDLCNFTFGPTFVNGNGSQFDVVLNGRQFLIQQLWLNASGGLCSMSWEGGKARRVGADFDADARTDFAVWRPNTGTWYVIRSNDGTQVGQQWGSQQDGDILVPGDYDGDGKTDFAVWRPATGTWFVIRSSDGVVISQQWGAPGDIPVPGDYDGDGKTDFAIWRPSTGTWWVIRSSDGIEFSFQFGNQAHGDIPVPGDYDGDGTTDFAVWRADIGTWLVIRSSDGNEVQQQWGDQTQGDVPVPGDYDGDGKTDFAVWRAHTGTWFVIRSSDGTTVSRQWGDQSSGDRPVPGDYDGDGKTDFAVWRASTGTWYVIRSSDGVETAQQWGVSTDIPVNKPIGQ